MTTNLSGHADAAPYDPPIFTAPPAGRATASSLPAPPRSPEAIQRPTRRSFAHRSNANASSATGPSRLTGRSRHNTTRGREPRTPSTANASVRSEGRDAVALGLLVRVVEAAGDERAVMVLRQVVAQKVVDEAFIRRAAPGSPLPEVGAGQMVEAWFPCERAVDFTPQRSLGGHTAASALLCGTHPQLRGTRWIEPIYAVGPGRSDGFRITVAGAIVVAVNIPNHTADIMLDRKPVHDDNRSYRTGLDTDAIAHLRCMGVLPSKDSRFIRMGR